MTRHHECVQGGQSLPGPPGPPAQGFVSPSAYNEAELQHSYEERMATLRDQEKLDQATEDKVD